MNDRWCVVSYRYDDGIPLLVVVEHHTDYDVTLLRDLVLRRNFSISGPIDIYNICNNVMHESLVTFFLLIINNA